MASHLVCAVSEILEGAPFLATIGGHQIGIICHEGKYHGLLNFCPHAGAPICEGRIEAMVVADVPGESARREKGRPVIRCPWHHWEFDLSTGRSVTSIGPKIRVFNVTVENEQVWVEM